MNCLQLGPTSRLIGHYWGLLYELLYELISMNLSLIIIFFSLFYIQHCAWTTALTSVVETNVFSVHELVDVRMNQIA